MGEKQLKQKNLRLYRSEQINWLNINSYQKQNTVKNGSKLRFNFQKCPGEKIAKIIKRKRIWRCHIKSIKTFKGVRMLGRYRLRNWDLRYNYCLFSLKKTIWSSNCSFQMIQQKIVKVMSNLQAAILICYRISNLVDSGLATMGQIAMVKAFVTERVRQMAKLGRQVMGGNGITTDNYVIKALADIQVIYTYEGTYDINNLIAGRQLTGLSSFKM